MRARTDPSTSPDASIGRTLSHYRVLSHLGDGGMGLLYKAEDLRLGRIVALKLLPPNQTRDPLARARLLREATAASTLDHANICTILEADEADDGQAFIAMVYYEGETLWKKLRRGPLALPDCAEITLQMARGLACAHDAGIVHRDVKPANIMITTRGDVKILDFGIALLHDTPPLTRPGTSMGTLSYMSPEQVQGTAVDARTDLWSLGVVLYEMLTGVRPFRGDYEAAVLHQILHGVPEPVRTLRPDVPEALTDLLERLLQKDRASRPEHAERVVTALSGVFQAHPPTATRTLPYPVDEPTRTASLEAPPASIAVLPFADMSPRRDQEYFCDGIAEELLNALTQIENLHVVARTSAFAFKGQSLDIREIGQRLGVGHVLEGSVRKAGDRLRIAAQLVAVESGYQAWTARYDRQMEDIFAIQDELALAIVQQVGRRFHAQEQAQRPGGRAVAPGIYELYLLGRHFLNRRTPESLQRAVPYFEQVIEEAPQYAPAYAGLATSFFMLRMVGILPQHKAFASAQQAIEQALRFEDAPPEAYVALGLFREFFAFDWPGAEAAFRQALTLNPGGNEAALECGLLLARLGRLDEGLALVQRALQLDPLSPFAHYGVAEVHFLARRYPEAIEQCWQALELEPHFVLAHIVLGWAYTMQGLHEEALVIFEKLATILGVEVYAIPHAGYVLARAGRTADARRSLQAVEAAWSAGLGSAVDPALVHTGLDEPDAALDWLERAYAERTAWLVFVGAQPCFDALRTHPRFVALLEAMRLRPS